MLKTLPKQIGRLILIAPLLTAIYSGIQLYRVSSQEPTLVTIEQMRTNPPERGTKVRLTGGGLYIGHSFSNHPEDSEEPTHWWVAYVAESELPALLAAQDEGDYPLGQLVLVEMSPQRYNLQYPKTLGAEHAFIKKDYEGAFRMSKDVPLRVRFTVSETYTLPRMSLYFFEIEGEQTATFNYKGLLIFSGILTLPFTLWFLTTFVPPREPVPSANEWANHSSTPPEHVLNRKRPKETGPQREAGSDEQVSD